MPDVIDRLTALACKFRDERNWKQFHNPKDLAISLVLEAGEVMEHFQWKSKEGAMGKYIRTHKKEIGEEISDVLYYTLLLAHDLDIDVEKASKLEGEYLEKYKNNNWIILNIAKTGGIGGCTLYWTRERCINSAMKCETRNEFRKKYRGSRLE